MQFVTGGGVGTFVEGSSLAPGMVRATQQAAGHGLTRSTVVLSLAPEAVENIMRLQRPSATGDDDVAMMSMAGASQQPALSQSQQASGFHAGSQSVARRVFKQSQARAPKVACR